MSTPGFEVRPLTTSVRVADVLRRFFDSCTWIFFKLSYFGKGKKIPPISDDFLKQPAIVIARRIRNQELSSVAVVEGCIRRIKEINKQLNCFVEGRFELALKEAQEADDLIGSGTKTIEQLEQEKPFLGVPFTTKDSIPVAGLHHTGGLVLRENVVSEKDCDVIRLLRESGAIALGLTNIPELCMWWETHNHVYGRTNNPYNTNRIVGGSSGGEGCIQAAGGSCFGIGSDIGGSIRMPAYFNGIFGHKPSRSIVSTNGQYPEPDSELIKSFLCIGPMTRFATDLKPTLSVISGENKKKLNLDLHVDISKLKVYYQIDIGTLITDKVHPDIVAAMNKTIQFFDEKFNIKAEEKNIEDLRQSISLFFNTMASKDQVGNHIMKNYSRNNVLKEIIKNMFGCSDNTFVVLLTALVDRGAVDFEGEEYKYHLILRDHVEDIFKNLLGDDGVFLFPTHPIPAPYHNQSLVKSMNFIYTALINILGLPATTIPLGLSREGLPIGIQVIANHNNDRFCLAVAEELEKAFGGWIEPQNKALPT